MITEKENLLRLANGQEPAWVPRKGVMQFPDDPENHKPCCLNAMPQYLPVTRSAKGGRTDIFGVEYEPTDSMNGMELPVPNSFILDDIRRWRDVIKVPSLDGIDWETVAKKSIEHIDRSETAVGMNDPGGYFLQLMNFMGFTEGLCALHEEPEEVTALYEYMADFYEEVTLNLIDYIKPEFFTINDDTATARNPFISPDMYRELIKPFHARLAKIAQDRGAVIEMHDCGRSEDSIDDWRDFGVKFWCPAQVGNDLTGIKKKYGNSLVLHGCWDSSGPAGWPGAEEELVRQAVRDCIDSFAPGGGFCFWASLYGAKGDERAKTHALWITDEYNKYGRTFYKRQG